MATYGNEVISVGGHKKNTDLRNCSRLSRHYTKPAFEEEIDQVQRGPNNSNCQARRSSRGRALRLYLTCIIPDPLLICVDGINGENIPDEEIAAAVAVGASVIEHWSTVSGIAVVWSG